MSVCPCGVIQENDAEIHTKVLSDIQLISSCHSAPSIPVEPLVNFCLSPETPYICLLFYSYSRKTQLQGLNWSCKQPQFNKTLAGAEPAFYAHNHSCWWRSRSWILPWYIKENGSNRGQNAAENNREAGREDNKLWSSAADSQCLAPPLSARPLHSTSQLWLPVYVKQKTEEGRVTTQITATNWEQDDDHVRWPRPRASWLFTSSQKKPQQTFSTGLWSREQPADGAGFTQL